MMSTETLSSVQSGARPQKIGFARTVKAYVSLTKPRVMELLLVVTVPALMWLWSHNDVINAHQRRYTRAELNQKLTRHGLRVLAASYNNFFLFPMAAGLILARRGRAEPELASPHFDDDAYQVEMEPAPPGMNGVLTGVGKVEAGLVKRVALPIGTSIICLAER